MPESTFMVPFWADLEVDAHVIIEDPSRAETEASARLDRYVLARAENPGPLHPMDTGGELDGFFDPGPLDLRRVDGSFEYEVSYEFGGPRVMDKAVNIPDVAANVPEEAKDYWVVWVPFEVRCNITDQVQAESPEEAIEASKARLLDLICLANADADELVPIVTRMKPDFGFGAPFEEDDKAAGDRRERREFNEEGPGQPGRPKE